MLKWLARPRTPPDLVTDDPLATIAPDAQPHVYAVSRINPLFVEEDSGNEESLAPRRKLTSSGYGSKLSSSRTERTTSGTTSSQSQQSRDVSQTRDLSQTRDTSHSRDGSQRSSLDPEREHAPIQVIEQNPAFVKSIQVSLKGVCAKKHCPLALSTIPEGKVDYCIPRPVWPRYENRQRKPPSVYADESIYWYSSLSQKAPDARYALEPRKAAMYEREQKSACEILRDLSSTIDQAANPEDVLRHLKRTINKSLELLSSETALRRLSESMRESDTVITMNRALSRSSSVNEWSFSETDPGRLELLRRLGKFDGSLYDPVRQSSSSSTSSGFSDLTLSPQSSASSAESQSPGSRPRYPVFVHDNVAQVPNGLRNAVLYGSLSGVEYEKLRLPELQPHLDAGPRPREIEPETKTEKLDYGYRGPDFTLDVHQAEKLMLRIAADKKRRCWCRISVSLLGLAFLLFSVMSFSMMLTRGQRLFGSL